MQHFTIGTRESPLATQQTKWVIEQLKQARKEVSFYYEPINTFGDRENKRALTDFKEKGIFTNEVEQALHDGSIDFAVHSLKDLPLQTDKQCVIAALPQREDARDVFISRSGQSLDELQAGAVIGTSSLRRSAQLKAAYPHLVTQSIRGPIDQRLAQLFAGDFDGIMLAAAGLHRLQKRQLITQYLPIDLFTPAAGQGALAIQCLQNNPTVYTFLQNMHDSHVQIATEVERSFMQAIDPDDKAAVGAYATSDKTGITLYVSILHPYRPQAIRHKIKGESAEEVVSEAIVKVIGDGALSLIEEVTTMTGELV